MDLEAEPVAGRVSSPAAGARPFAGWLELMAALDQARAAAVGADPGAAPAESSSAATREPNGQHVRIDANEI